MPDSKTGVLFDKSNLISCGRKVRKRIGDSLSVVVRQEKHGRHEQDPKEHPQDDTSRLAGSHVVQRWDPVSTTNDDEERQDTRRQGVVERDESNGPFERIASGMDENLNTSEDDSAKACRNAWRNRP